MDDEMDLMIQRKSFVLETGKQEYDTKKDQTFFYEEEEQKKSFRQMLMEETEATEISNLSLTAIANNIKQSFREFEIPRQKGRIFMRRYVAES